MPPTSGEELCKEEGAIDMVQPGLHLRSCHIFENIWLCRSVFKHISKEHHELAYSHINWNNGI